MRTQRWLRILACTAVTAMVTGGAGGVALADGPAATQPAAFDSNILAGPKASGPPATQPNGTFSGDRSRRDRLRELIAGLNLSPDQRSKVQGIALDYKKKHDAFEAAHGTEVANLRVEMAAAREAHDRDKAKELRTQLEPLLAQAPRLKDLIEQIRMQLTPDQQKTLDAKVAENMKAAQTQPGGGGGTGFMGTGKRAKNGMGGNDNPEGASANPMKPGL